MVFGTVQSDTVGFRVNIEYATTLWHCRYTRGPFQAPVRSSRHGIDWNLLQELNRLAMRIFYSFYKRFKVQWVIVAANRRRELSSVSHATIVVNGVTNLF